MNRSVSSRARMRALSLAAAVALVSAVPAAGTATARPAADAAPAAAVHKTRTAAADSPVGKWQVELLINGQIHTNTLYFTPDGRAFVRTGGAGRWEATDATHFTFRLAEPMIDTEGNYLGWIKVHQNAVLQGDTYTSSGISKVYDAQDNLVASTEVKQTGTRS